MKNLLFLLAISLSLSNVQAQSKNEDWSRSELMWSTLTPEQQKESDAEFQAWQDKERREVITELLLIGLGLSLPYWGIAIILGIIRIVEWCNWKFKKFSIDQNGNLIT